ncbi:hypothetical protein [Caniella muris]|uniref:hypothetical protein n=1 Tax=Caniella muris TaxID=2941502 RepID=UPI00203EBFA0|nr:hypothetical protein [Caniella muris]
MSAVELAAISADPEVLAGFFRPPGLADGEMLCVVSSVSPLTGGRTAATCVCDPKGALVRSLSARSFEGDPEAGARAAVLEAAAEIASAAGEG